MIEKTSKRQKVTLVQRGNDGSFFFTNALQRDIENLALGILIENSSLIYILKGSQISKVKIVPTPTLAQSSIPSLGISSQPKPHGRLFPQKKMQGVKALPGILYFKKTSSHII